MRLSRFHLSTSVLILSLLLAGPAFANTISMTYLGHQGAVAQNGSPFIGYPYYVSINETSRSKAVMCDSFFNEVNLGQTWNANASPFLRIINGRPFGSRL
jgi:hypothetical protein